MLNSRQKIMLFFGFLLLLLGGVRVLTAFNPSLYLINNESMANVQNFTLNLNGTTYELVLINHTPSFVLRPDNSLCNNTHVISTILSTYFKIHNPLPTNLTSRLLYDLDQYNKSRNDGVGEWKGKEEYMCRRVLFMTYYPCTNATNCKRTAEVVCALSGIGCSDPSTVYPDVYQFGIASYGTDKLINKLENQTKYNLTENLSVSLINTMLAEVEQLDEYRKDIESTPFRMPVVPGTCPTCFGICPPLQLNQTYLIDMETALEHVKGTIEKRKVGTQTVAYVLNSTRVRQAHYIELIRTSKWAHIVDRDIAYINKSLIAYNNISTRVDDDIADNYASSLEGCRTTLRYLLSVGNFSSINKTFDVCNRTVVKLNNRTAYLVSFLQHIKKLRQTAENKLQYLQCAVSTAQQKKDVMMITSGLRRAENMDLQGKPFTSWQLQEKSYESTISEEDKLIRELSISPTNSLIQSLLLTYVASAQRLTATIFSASTYRTISKFLPVVSAVLLFAFTFIFIFLALLGWARGMSLSICGVLIAIFLVIGGLASLAFFIGLTGLAKSMNPFLFVHLVKRAGVATIVVKAPAPNSQTNSSSVAPGAIGECAKKISTALSTDGVATAIYYEYKDQCYDASGKKVKCKDFPNQIVLVPSPHLAATYQGPYVLSAEFDGPESFYKTCPMAQIMSR